MSGRLIDTYLTRIGERRTVRNWPTDMQAIVDGYRAYTTISHSFHNDAIHNKRMKHCKLNGGDKDVVF
jgi:hypothetical protein